MKLRPIIKCVGGKAYLKDWIIANFPPNYEALDFVEPFAGGLSIVLNKVASPIETINDLDIKLVDIYFEVRDNCKEFQENLYNCFPYTEKTFNLALDNKLAEPYNEYVLRRMSRGGLRKTFAWSERLRGGRPGDENGYLTALAQLPDISNRLRNVDIRCGCALKLLQEFAEHEDTFLAYLDPVYLKATRTAKTTYGEYEMDDATHERLADILNDNQFHGKVVLSGYASPKYDEWYGSWNRIDKSIKNHSGQGKTKNTRVESLWKNF